MWYGYCLFESELLIIIFKKQHLKSQRKELSQIYLQIEPFTQFKLHHTHIYSSEQFISDAVTQSIKIINSRRAPKISLQDDNIWENHADKPLGNKSCNLRHYFIPLWAHTYQTFSHRFKPTLRKQICCWMTPTQEFLQISFSLYRSQLQNNSHSYQEKLKSNDFEIEKFWNSNILNHPIELNLMFRNWYVEEKVFFVYFRTVWEATDSPTDFRIIEGRNHRRDSRKTNGNQRRNEPQSIWSFSVWTNRVKWPKDNRLEESLEL